MHKLASCYHLIGNFKKEKEITLQSLEYDVPQPEFSCRLGEFFLKNNQFSQAAYWYKQAIEAPSANSTFFIEQQPFKTWLPQKQLGFCYFQLKDYKQSYHHNKMVLRFLPNDEETLNNYESNRGVNGFLLISIEYLAIYNHVNKLPLWTAYLHDY
nr:hypothetical protein [Bacillus cereus]